MNKMFLFLLLNGLLLINAFSQDPSDVEDFPTKNRASLYTNIGFSYNSNVTTLNNYLTSNGFPMINRMFEDWNYFGIEGQYQRFIMKINLSHSFNSNSQTNNTNDFKTRMTINGVMGMFGYEVLSKKKWSIFPLVGFLNSGTWLELTEQINDTMKFSDLIINPNIIKINQQNPFIIVGEIGIRKNPNKNTSLGIYLGYKHDFNKQQWNYQNIEFADLPRFIQNEFYLNFSFQLNLFFKTANTGGSNRGNKKQKA